jgi:hypothetical protein
MITDNEFKIMAIAYADYMTVHTGNAFVEECKEDMNNVNMGFVIRHMHSIRVLRMTLADMYRSCIKNRYQSEDEEKGINTYFDTIYENAIQIAELCSQSCGLPQNMFMNALETFTKHAKTLDNIVLMPMLKINY